MPLPNDLEWIETRFDPYNIVYLDPLVCQLASAMTWRTRYLTRDQTPTQQFVKKLLDQLPVIPGEKLSATYLEPKGLGTRFKKDRRLQQNVTRWINDSLSGQADQIVHFGNLHQFFAARDNLGQDRSSTGPLVALDTMFAARATLPEDMRLSLPTHYEPEPRSVECVLIDQHPNLLTLYDRRLALSVDHRAFYEWTEDFTKILVIGWHPFARTIGFYASSPGGQPFIKVLAILARPFRSVDEILLPETGMQATTIQAMASLHAVLRNNLAAIQAKIASFATPSSAAAPPAASTTIPPIAHPTPAVAPTGAPTAATVPPPASRTTPPTAPPAPSPTPAQKDTATPVASAAGSVAPGTTTSRSTPTGAAPSMGPARPAAAPSPHALSRPNNPRLTFAEYRGYMYPIYVMQLICGLNGITGSGLRRGARSSYILLRDYLEQLQKLHAYKDYLSVQVLEMAPPDGIEALLEEPPRLNGQELAPYD